MYSSIIRKDDGSYVIERNGMPYHVPNNEQYDMEWQDIDAYAKEHPEVVSDELPYEPTFDEIKSTKRVEINAAYNTATSSLVATYPATELLTFDKQEAEARAWDADHSASTPLIDALALGRGIDKAELVRRIIAKADAFAVATGYLTGQRQKYEDQLEAATTAEEIAAIVPEYKLPDAENATEDSMSAFFYNNL